MTHTPGSRPSAATPSPTEDDWVIEVRELSKTYGSDEDAVEAIAHIDLAVRKGEFLSIVGPSGSGKTTFLMCLSGLLEATSGAINLHGQQVTEPVPGLAVVFQDYSRSLFPWFTNRGNVAQALWDHDLDQDEKRRRVHQSLESVGLGDVPELYPWQLSGGMQQRVAIARALVTSPEVLVMDEPFASVDAQTRASLEDLLLDVWRRIEVTIVFVTHDIDEAVYLSDRIAVMSPRPSTVVEDVAVPLDRPRDQLTTRSSPEFAQLRTDVYQQVMRPEGL